MSYATEHKLFVRDGDVYVATIGTSVVAVDLFAVLGIADKAPAGGHKMTIVVRGGNIGYTCNSTAASVTDPALATTGAGSGACPIIYDNEREYGQCDETRRYWKLIGSAAAIRVEIRLG
jgi:hypothetical protein